MLAPLYAKAALGALRRRGRDLPDAVAVREDVAVDEARLAAYARVCGCALDGVLPPTYPHLLGFELQLRLMADRAFPLALPGLVHIRNTISMDRRIEVGERLRVSVHAERLVAHPKGAQVDLVTDVAAGTGPVWRGRSTYLARGAAAPPGDAFEPPAPAGAGDGPSVAVWQVAADTGRRYARVSGDVNPIHLHRLAARAVGFPRAIAHGMWTAARALAALQGRLPDALTFDVAFGSPVLLPSAVELRTRRATDGWDIDVREAGSEASGAAGSGRVHLRAAVRS
jgi:acyl dehydratase